MTCFYKIQSTGLPRYSLQFIPTNNHSQILRKPLNIPHYNCRTDTFKRSFFPNIINEWIKLDEKIKGAASFSLFKASLLKIVRPHANSTYRIHNPIEIRLLACLRLNLSHLNEHKLKHNFTNCVNQLCSRSIKPETTLHFFSALPQLRKTFRWNLFAVKWRKFTYSYYFLVVKCITNKKWMCKF